MGLDVRSTVMAWDTALRDADWDTARTLLTDDAIYTAPDPPIDCASPDEIVDLMRSFKGINPDVEMLALETIGNRGVAHLRQPAWEYEWFQVLTMDQGRISRLEDFATREQAVAGSHD